MENVLREVLLQDKTILSRRDELLAALEEKVPTNLRRDYASIKRAIGLNIGEIFLVGESDKNATKRKVAEILKSSGMQEARINFVVETFTKALDWDKVPFLNFDDESPKEVVEKPGEKIVEEPVKEVVEESVEEPITSKPKTSLTKKVEPKEESAEPNTFETTTSTADFNEPARTQNNDETIEKLSREFDEMQARSESTAPPPQENITPSVNETPTTSNINYGRIPQNHKSSIFTIEGRLNRLAYFKQFLKLIGLTIIATIATGISEMIGGLIFIAVVVGSYMTSIRRLHDLDKSGWWALIFLIPYVNVIFSFYVLLAPGTNGYNRFGPDPLTE